MAGINKGVGASVTILYDNETTREDLKAAWGFSAWIRAGDKDILFDTGWDGSILLANMEVLGFDPKDLDAIVLSHRHWDHIGGLPTLLSKTDKIDVFVPASFSQHLRGEIGRKHSVHSILEPQEISDGLYSTGELEGHYGGTTIGEQALAIDSPKGLLVVTGCSHAPLDGMIKQAKGFGSVYGVVGGFHGFDDYDALNGLGLIVPTHCTKHKKEIRERFGNQVDEGGVGWSRRLG